jgi:four helix bundle protein
VEDAVAAVAGGDAEPAAVDDAEAAGLAEGNGRTTPLDYAAFLDRARASTFETDTWLLVAADKAWITPDLHRRLEADLDAISAILYAMTRTLRSRGKLNSRT